MNATENYLVATGVLGMGLIAASIFLIRKSHQILELKKKEKKLRDPKDDNEKLELWTIQQKLYGPAGNFWYMTVSAALSTIGAIGCIVTEVVVFIHGINW